MRRFGVVTLALPVGLTACSPSDPAHAVAHDRHSDARAKAMAVCRNDPAEAKASGNCSNAAAADGAATSQGFWTVPAAPSRVRRSGAL